MDLSATSDAIQKIDPLSRKEYNLSTNQKVDIASGHFRRDKLPVGDEIDVPVQEQVFLHRENTPEENKEILYLET